MKSQVQILAQIAAPGKKDILGFEVREYIPFLDFEHAAPFLKAETTKEQWSETYKEPTSENILKIMLDYMLFAWAKANDCISASRSISHFDAWVWLMDDGFFEQYSQIEYEHYGKEKLVAICEKYGWDWKTWDNGVRTNRG